MKSHGQGAEPESPQALHEGRSGCCERSLSETELRTQNAVFAGSGGVSQNNQHAGFLPAYQNTLTGETVLSCYADGTLAAVHLLEGLPDHWVASRDQDGRVCRALLSVIAGFIRDDIFYTREAAAQVLAEEAGA